MNIHYASAEDCGGLTLPFPGYEQPMELIMAKALVNRA